ncbi:hypothetical protein F5Y04DRAFT_287458 [Hypomontagnella monticulosa]|nr:hypothetical protein F5Y04DRAFT_287458 [Hypomontagnella monticulosa]
MDEQAAKKEAKGQAEKEAEKQAMMRNLGNLRIEEFADDGNNSTLHAQPETQIGRKLPPMIMNDPAANAFRNVQFDDEDSRATKTLDPLDGGNAHRLNRGSPGQHVHPRNGAPLQSHSQLFPQRQGAAAASSRINTRYDRLRPSPPPRSITNSIRPRYQETSLGGLVPPGGQVKRWEPLSNRLVRLGTTTTAATTATTANISGVGRGTPPRRVQSQPTPPAATGLGRGALQHIKPSSIAPLPARSILPASKGIGSGQPSTNVGNVIYQESGLMIKFVVEPGAKEVSGQFLIYGPVGGKTATWELRSRDGDEKVLRGEIRHCLQLTPLGTSVHLRRQENSESAVLSSQITFPSVATAQRFASHVNRHRGIAKLAKAPAIPEPLGMNAGDAAADTNGVAQPSNHVKIETNSGTKVDVGTDVEAETGEAPKQNSPASVATQPGIAPLGDNEDLIAFSPSKRPCPTQPSERSERAKKSKPSNPSEPCEPSKPSETSGHPDHSGIPDESGIPDDSGFLSDDLIALDDQKLSTVEPKAEQSQQEEAKGVDFYAPVGAISLSRDYQLEAIEKMADEECVSVISQRILSKFTSQEYVTMMSMSDKLLEVYAWAQTIPELERLKQAALDIATLRLEREDGFKDLDEYNQMRAIAAVYGRIRNRNPRIVRPVEQIMALRESQPKAQSSEVKAFNDYFYNQRWNDPIPRPNAPRPGPQKYGGRYGPGAANSEAIRDETTKPSAIGPNGTTSVAVQNSSAPQVPGVVKDNGAEQEASQKGIRSLKFDESTQHILPHLRKGLTSSRWAGVDDDARASHDSTEKASTSLEKSHGSSPLGDMSSLSGIVKRVEKI